MLKLNCKKSDSKSVTEILVTMIANEYELDPALVAAVILTESSGVPDVARLEQGFYRRYVKQLDLPITEEICRAASFGLMQIMGQTAREFGFMDHFDKLEQPEVNIDLGCKILSKYINDKKDLRRGLLRYNGGGDLTYPDKVLSKVDDGSYKKLWAVIWE